MAPRDPLTRAFLAYINQMKSTKTIFDITHRDLETPYNTPITGSITINGGSQTGATINVSSSLNKILKAGDVIKIAGLNLVYDIAADMANPTASSITIFPPILAGGSPAHGAAITITGVKFRAVLTGSVQFPSRSGGKLYAGLTLNFRECP